jgi:hypothetical protein
MLVLPEIITYGNVALIVLYYLFPCLQKKKEIFADYWDKSNVLNVVTLRGSL